MTVRPIEVSDPFGLSAFALYRRYCLYVGDLSAVLRLSEKFLSFQGNSRCIIFFILYSFDPLLFLSYNLHSIIHFALRAIY